MASRTPKRYYGENVFGVSDLDPESARSGELGENQDAPLDEFSDVLSVVNKVLEKRYYWVRPLWRLGACLMAAGIVIVIAIGSVYGNAAVYAEELSGTSSWKSCLVFSSEEFSRTNFAVVMAKQGSLTGVIGLVVVGSSSQPLNNFRFDMLPVAMMGSILGLFQALASFNFSQIIPAGIDMSASLVSLRQYVRPSMYNDIEHRHEMDPTLNSVDCGPAFHLNEAFIEIQLFMLGLIAVSFFAMLPIEFRRRKLLYRVLRLRARRGHADIHRIRGRAWIRSVVQVAVLCFVVSQIVKMDVQVRSLYDIQTVLFATQLHLQDAYPFEPFSFDPALVTLTVTMLAVVFSLSHRSYSGLLFAAFFGVASLISFYESWFGVIDVFDKYDLDTADGCARFFQSPLFGNPDRPKAMSYCYDTWISFMASSVWLVATNAMIFLTVWTNYKSTVPHPVGKRVMSNYFEVEDPYVAPEFDPSFVERLLHGVGEEGVRPATPESEGLLNDRLLPWSIEEKDEI